MSGNNPCGLGFGDTHVLKPTLGLSCYAKEGEISVLAGTIRGRSSVGC